MAKKVISATITPLKADGTLDRTGLKNVFERNIRHGINGVFLFGSMGEWGSFSDAFKEETVELAASILKDKADLLVGINATSLPLTMGNMKRYQKYDFDSYVFMLPAKTSALDPIKSIMTVLDTADRPVYYYHCPPNNGRDFSLDQFAAIMAHPNLKGIKNSSSNMWLRRELIAMKRERGFKTLLLEGQEWALDEALLVGNDGMVCGMAALTSKPMVELARAAERGDWNEARRLQELLIEVYHGVYGIDIGNCWNGQKYALVKLGLIETPFTFAQEMSSLTEDAKKRVENCIAKYKNELD